MASEVQSNWTIIWELKSRTHFEHMYPARSHRFLKHPVLSHSVLDEIRYLSILALLHVWFHSTEPLLCGLQAPYLCGSNLIDFHGKYQRKVANVTSCPFNMT